MTPVPASPDPESGPPTRPATGRRRAGAVPPLSVGCLDDVRPGSLLVAMPALSDPTFAGTVVYVLDHSDSGTARGRARAAQPGRDPRRPARLVRARRRARRVPRGRAVRDRHRAVPGRRAGRRARPRAAGCAGSPATSTSSTSTAIRPSWRTSSPACGCSPATRGGRPGSWPARSPRARGPACRGGPDDVLSPAGRPGLWRQRDGPADRPAGGAVHRTGRPHGQLGALPPRARSATGHA